MKPTTRRTMFGQLLGLGVGATVGLPLEAFPADQQSESQAKQKKLKVMVAGAHPDDPESGCGGTIARYSDLGHEVVVVYLTRGEAGIQGKSHQEAASIRTLEVQKACEILKARPVFAGQIDGATQVDPAAYDSFYKIIETESPDLVFTQWPIDSHRDHRATSLLVYDAWLQAGKKFPLYYYEVYSGIQTQTFSPTHYADITRTADRKRAATFAHVSQTPDQWYPHHEAMDRFRGFEYGCDLAEAFTRHVQSPDDALPMVL